MFMLFLLTESFITTTALTSTTVKTISSSPKDQITSFTVPPTKMFETVSSELVTLSDITAATEKIQLNGKHSLSLFLAQSLSVLN